VNGTIAVYQNNIFLKYEVKPTEFYSEDSSFEKPVEETAEDGSTKIFFSNGTIRYIPSPYVYSDSNFTDCFSNSTCIVFFNNGSRARYDNEMFVSIKGPIKAPVVREEAKDPNYNYVDKTGPKIQAYDKAQGGKKKYKEEYQNNENQG
jgi:hypothetical protein